MSTEMLGQLSMRPQNRGHRGCTGELQYFTTKRWSKNTWQPFVIYMDAMLRRVARSCYRYVGEHCSSNLLWFTFTVAYVFVTFQSAVVAAFMLCQITGTTTHAWLLSPVQLLLYHPASISLILLSKKKSSPRHKAYYIRPLNVKPLKNIKR